MAGPLARNRVKRALPDGRWKLVMTGVELLEKLVPLISPTYANPISAVDALCIDGSGASGPPEIGDSMPTRQVISVPQKAIGRAGSLAVDAATLAVIFACN
jgi:hypothetical protein